MRYIYLIIAYLMFTRIITSQLIDACFRKKAIILYWPRQIGKTTSCKTIIAHFPSKKSLYISGDDSDIIQLRQPSLSFLSQSVAWYDIVVIDEAQRIQNIWLIIKLLVDNFPEKQIITTGSSSFDLANTIVEPLTGRALFWYLYPLSIQETNPIGILSTSQLEQKLIYGSYPNVVAPDYLNPSEYLKLLVDQYLYKDIIAFDGIKKSSNILKLLQALALQIGSEFSYTELANTVGMDKNTIQKYISILEQSFIIKVLRPLHRNQRREIKSLNKLYFRDLGVRNALLNNFNPLSLRSASDIGALWENFCIIERTKYIHYNKIAHNQYFWREVAGAEIDYIEQYGDQYDCYECKFSEKKWASLPITFAQWFPHNNFTVWRPDTIWSSIR